MVARSSDGLVEGIELPSNHFAVGIQCHPEELVGKQDWAGRLFAALVAPPTSAATRMIVW